VRWQSLAKVLCCGPAHGGVQAGVQAGVQTAVARSGKGAVQGAAQACCEAAESGRGAVLSRVLYRLWLAAVRSGGKVWETCCAACCRLARSGKGYAAGCWLREGTVHRNFQRCCRGDEVWHGGVLCRLLSREVWQRCCAGCCAGCWPERGGAGYRAGLLGAGCWTVQWRTLGKGLLCRLLPRSAVARFGKGAVHAAIQGAVGGTVRRVLCRLLSTVYCAGCCPQCEATALQRIMLGTTYLYLAVFLYFLGGAVNEKSNKKEEVQTRITNIFQVFLP